MQRSRSLSRSHVLRPLARLLLGVTLLARGPLAAESPRKTRPSPGRTTCLEARSPRDWTISFVHRIKNAASSPLRRVDVAIAVPRSDERQTIRSIRYDPEPASFTTDGWEQKTAHFLVDEVPPRSEVEVRLEISVTLRDLDWLVTERDVGPGAEIPERIARHYLRNGENYKLDREIVRRAAARIDAPGSSALEKLRRIHDFVIDSIEYSRDDRWEPADDVLRQGRGSCSEYSYLMIALCRTSGIPARYVGGTWLEGRGASPPRAPEDILEGGTRVDRVFHRWVEVYLPRVGWFAVDPTQDDAAEKEGEPYRYFGKLPWSYLAMTHGDGDPFESGPLGWEYRSSMKWHRAPAKAEAVNTKAVNSGGVHTDNVTADRYAVWKAAGDGGAAGGVGN